MAAADVELPDDVLGRIEQIVPPGININPAEHPAPFRGRRQSVTS